jgi:adenylyltransferase/sulfurtransferase
MNKKPEIAGLARNGAPFTPHPTRRLLIIATMTEPATSTLNACAAKPAATHELGEAAMLRYSRHLLLDAWGFEAQQAIAGKTALVLGLGGLGCAAAQVLASAGVGHLLLVDGDTVELSNLQRQILHDMNSLGQAKVLSAQRRLAAINPVIAYTTVAQRLDAAALAAAVAQADVVLDCSDNLPTRLALNAACVAAAKPLVSGSAIRWQGQGFVYLPGQAAPCYQCLYPQTGADAVEIADEPCATMGVFAPLVMQVGSWQAAQALKILASLPVQTGHLHLFDVLHGRSQQVQVGRQGACPVCALKP